ncbi:glmZ(sRNA)-inactivating NTPase [Corynebacterium urogenitale]|uniref:GlmZ(SRNA)-inactivating NTPase n=1 Tax=Corynebacterium urogenitale TaxID=2487892 RepID=A0A5J6Z873_9CORY|nr:RNase adapter RapZ [Corynebacterium urogenitale]QFQ02392.1 glmZ(sRNA)-inactivating NTPase [Corynebacterium urogenitale]
MSTANHHDNQRMPSLILITGMSGAGRRATSAALEELGWYVAENLPPELIVRMAEMSFEDDSPIERLAIVTDVRSRDFAGNLSEVLATLSESGRRPVVLFLDATDAALIRRYDEVRRTHPLQGEGTLKEGIDREREMLHEIRERADVVLDTTNTSVHELRKTLETYFAGIDSKPLRVNLQSFGFKHGAPTDVDVLLDARFLPNPYWEQSLREYRGTDPQVAEFVFGQPGAKRFLDATEAMLETMLDGYREEGKSFLSIAVGCTGGHHRSVAVVEELANRLENDGVHVRVSHRDLER